MREDHPPRAQNSVDGSAVRLQRQPIKQTFQQMHNLLQIIIRKSFFCPKEKYIINENVRILKGKFLFEYYLVIETN